MSFTAVPHPEDAPPRTVAAWLERIVAGADPAPLAHQAHRAAAEEQSTAVWLHVCSGTAWQAQMSVLGARLSSNADRRALLQRYPLLGVPFAAKDNIDIAGAPTTAACPVSIFAHSVADAAHVLSVIEGPDAADAYSAYRPGAARWPGRPRIGVAKAPRRAASFAD